MLKQTFFLMVAVILLLSARTNMLGQTQMGISIADGQVRNFYLSMGQYYHAPEQELVIVRERHIPDEEAPVVFFIARRAHVEPARIIEMREDGQSWMDISLHFGMGPDVYYVPAREVSGPPYGNAYGYYKHHPRREWRKMRLSDDEIVNFVNLRFASDQYGCRPEDVVRMRSEGRSFVAIHDEFRNGNHGWNDRDDDGKGKGKGHGKHKHRKDE